jgi:hypothetical protein
MHRGGKPKENMWLKKRIGRKEYDDKNCHLICFLNFHGVLGKSSFVTCTVCSMYMYVQALCVCISEL